MEDYYEYLDSNGVTTLYKLIKDDTVALIDSYSVTINGITTNLDNHVNNADIHTPIATIEGMIDTAVGSLNYATPDYVDTKISGLVNSAPETLDTLKELSDALGNDSNFATTVANQIGTKASKDNVYTKQETDILLEGKANSEHSHVVSDITDFPTIPTKVSDLTNDSGYITNVSWSDITNKPNFSTVATSGSYTDLSNTPTIPTKVSQLENDMGFGTGGDTSDCVHKTGDETIAGTKTFTASPFVSNYALTNGYFTKLNTIARNEVPSQIYHSAFRVFDKNSKTLGEYCVEKSTSGSSLLHMDVHTEDSEGNDIMESVYLNLSNDGSTVRFHPAKNNRIDLGMASSKWAKVYSDDVVHTSGNETINGVKTFTVAPYASNSATTNGYYIKLNALARNEVPSQLYHATFRAYDKNDKILGEYCVEKSTSGETLLNMNVRSEDASGNQIAHSLQLRMTNDGSVVRFIPTANNKVQLGDVNAKWLKVHSDDVVHTSGDETIAGVKTFTLGPVASNDATTNGYFIKVNPIGRGEVPTQLYHATFRALDKNDKILGEYCIEKSTTGSTLAQINVRSEDSNGKQLSQSLYFNMSNDGSAVRFYPNSNNKVDLGMSNYKWANVYATTFNGNLSGTIASSTTATTQATSDNSTKIATTAWVRTYVNSVAGANTVGSSVSAYWSNSSNVTATGQASSDGKYPECYSKYVTKTPVVGTIYSGAQLYTVLNTYASATGSLNNNIYVTNNTAQATFSNPINATGKYLCTTANTVKFRAYTATGSSSAVGSSSVVGNASTKSIFIRVE